jgi:putative two-component system response regulator
VAVAHAGTTQEQAVAVMWAGALVVLAGVCATIAQHRARRIAQLRQAKEEVARRLARVVEYRDDDTGGHIERMAEYARLIGRAVGLDDTACRELRFAATMHDIGKVAVPDAILLKPGKLTAEERAVMETHARVGHEMLSGSGTELLDLAATIALTHHERWDGAGYPCGLAAEAIPLVGRIVAVADVFDAVTSKRVYKDAVEVERAIAIIEEGSGTQFDPVVVSAFMEAIDDIQAARARCIDPEPQLETDPPRIVRDGTPAAQPANALAIA